MSIELENKLDNTMYDLTEEYDISEIIEALRYQVQDIAENGNQEKRPQFEQVAVLLKNVQSMMHEKNIKI